MVDLQVSRSDAKVTNQDFLARLTSTTTLVTVVHVLMAGVFTYFSFDNVPINYLVGWLMLWFSLSLWRILYYTKVLPNPSVNFQQKRRYVLFINFSFGLAQSLSIVFFMYFTLIERVIYTLIILGSVSGSVTIIGFRSMFVLFATPIMLSLALVWVIIPYPDSNFNVQLILSTLILLYFAILVADSQSYFDLHEKSDRYRSQLKAVNAQLTEAFDEAKKASESKTRFLASASHDLRQPIHTMSLLSAALQMQKMDNPTKEIAGRLEQAIDILAAQMDSLLDISKFDAGLVECETSTFDLNEFCQRLQAEYSITCKSKGLMLNYLSSEQQALVDSDRNLLERLLRNLLSNAVRYTNEGTIDISLSKNLNKWRVRVCDTGIGISEDAQQNIFEEFYQVKNFNRDRTQGLGLGLAIVKRTAELLGAEIEVKSELGVGSSFSVQLPKAVHSVESKSEQGAIAHSSIHGLRVLIIDDETHVREALKLALSNKGCLVTLAQNSHEAMECSMNQELDLAIADLRLAEEKNGIDAIELVRTVLPNLPALLVSGDTAPDQLRLAENARIKMLHKPVNLTQLELEISSLMNK